MKAFRGDTPRTDDGCPEYVAAVAGLVCRYAQVFVQGENVDGAKVQAASADLAVQSQGRVSGGQHDVACCGVDQTLTEQPDGAKVGEAPIGENVNAEFATRATANA